MANVTHEIREAVRHGAQTHKVDMALLALYLKFLFNLCRKDIHSIYVALLPAAEQQPVFDALQAVLIDIKGARDFEALTCCLVSISPSCLTAVTHAHLRNLTSPGLWKLN